MRVRVSAVFEQAGEILCMKYIYGGKEVFALPGGGVDKDIPLQEAIVNEWKEELGIKVDIGDIILIGEAPAGKRHPQTLQGAVGRDPFSGCGLGFPRKIILPTPLSRCGQTAVRLFFRRAPAFRCLHQQLHGTGLLVTGIHCRPAPQNLV